MKELFDSFFMILKYEKMKMVRHEAVTKDFYIRNPINLKNVASCEQSLIVKEVSPCILVIFVVE